MRRAGFCVVQQLVTATQHHALFNPSEFGLRACPNALAHAACVPVDVHSRLSLPFSRDVHQSASLQASTKARRVPQRRPAPRAPRPAPRESDQASLQWHREETITATPAAQAILKQTERENALVLTRNLELGDLMFGYEQARQLLLKDAHGRSLLALAEQPGNLLAGVLLRQIFDSSRAFTIDVFDVPHLLEKGSPPDNPMFRIKRDFPWFNVMAWLRRDIFVHDEEDRIVAAVTRVWQPFHRTYELYHVAPQHDEDEDAPLTLFGQVSTPFWSAIFTWRYPVLDAHGHEVTCVHRVFGSGVQGLATQIFTEVGNYYMPFDKQHLALRQRLATVACAMSIDYDYYSHRAGGGGWLWPIAIFGGGSNDD